MGYHLNCLDETVFIAVPKPLLNEFGIHHRLESCDLLLFNRCQGDDLLMKQLEKLFMYLASGLQDERISATEGFNAGMITKTPNF